MDRVVEAMRARESRARASASARGRRGRRACRIVTVAAVFMLAVAAMTTRTARADGDGGGGDDDDDHYDHDTAMLAVGSATCAVESDGLTWCAYAGVASGLDVAYAPVSNGTTTVNHWIRATFSGALNPGTNGWASIGPGTRMSNGKVVVGGGGAATTKYTMTSTQTPTNPCSTNCPISEESVTSTATATTLKFKLVDANSAVGTTSFVWGMQTLAWPAKHSRKGAVSVSLAGQGGSSSVSGSKLNRDVAHGVLMVLAWVIFMPIGSASTALKNLLPNGLWFYAHLSAIGAGSLLFAIALGLLIGRDEHGKDSKLDKHYSLAIAVIALWLIQLFLGVFRPNKKPEDGARLGFIPTSLRPAWFWAHRLIAPTVLALAAATIFVGADLMRDRYGTSDSVGVRFLRPGVLGGVYAAVVAVGVVLHFAVDVPMKSRASRFEPVHDDDGDSRVAFELA